MSTDISVDTAVDIAVNTWPLSAEISVDTVSTVYQSSVGRVLAECRLSIEKMSALGRYCQQYNDRYISTNTDQLSAAIGQDTGRYSLDIKYELLDDYRRRVVSN